MLNFQPACHAASRTHRLAGIFVGVLLLLNACASPGAPGTNSPEPANSPTPRPTIQPTLSPAASPTGMTSPTAPSEPVPAYLQPAQAYLSQRTGVPPGEIRLASSEAVDWPDGCLGVSLPNVMCSQVVTPGYKAVFATPQGEVEVHTDQEGQSYTLALPAQTAVEFERTGGIAGICQRLSIGANGVFLQQDCRGAGAGVMSILPQAAWKQLQADLQRYGKVEFQTRNPVPDQFVDQYTFNGQGRAAPSAEEQQKLGEFLAGLYDPSLNSDVPANPNGSATPTGSSGGGSGVTGQVLVGPACPGPVTAGQSCPDKPYPTTLSVLSQAANQAVTQVETDAQGKFTIDLAPGAYTLHPVIAGQYPRGDDQVVEVQAGHYTQVEIHLDSGIR